MGSVDFQDGRWPHVVSRLLYFVLYSVSTDFSVSSEVPGLSRTTSERLCYPVCTIDVNQKAMKMFAGSHTEIRPFVSLLLPACSPRMLSSLHSGAIWVLGTLHLLPFITRNKTFIYILEHSITRWRFHFDERRSICGIICLFISAIYIILYSQ